MSKTSLQEFARPLNLELRPSRVLLLASLIVYLAALLACWCAAPALPAFAFLSALLVLHWICWYRRMVALSAPSAVSRIAWDRVRGWRIYSSAAGWRAAALVTPVFVSRQLAVVGFRLGRFARRRAVVTVDSLDRDGFRRLRVRLLQSAHGCGDRV